MKKSIIFYFAAVLFISACAAVPVRQEAKINLNLPVGKLEGNQFIGIRFPFKVEKPPQWEITTEIPDFMESLGYEKPGLQESELFIFNPLTFSNLQIDFTPAGRYSKFDQESITWLTTSATASLLQELKETYGKDLQVKIGPTIPVNLKGVQFAAQKYAIYSVQGKKESKVGFMVLLNHTRYLFFIWY